MKNNELEKVVNIIVDSEKIIQTSNDLNAIEKAKKDIELAALNIRTLEDIELIDDMVQKKLQKLLDL